MDTLHIAKKGRMLDALEKFYIFKEAKAGNQLNDKLTIQANPIFEAVIQNTPYREHYHWAPLELTQNAGGNSHPRKQLDRETATPLHTP